MLHPVNLPPGANAGERTLHAALSSALPADTECWYQARLPGRRGRLDFHADFLLLDANGLLIIEVKGWHAPSIISADESRVLVRQGVTVQHPLLQGFRYQAALRELLRQAGHEQAPLRSCAALPFVSSRELDAASWGNHFPRARTLLRDDMGRLLSGKLSAVPPLPAQPLQATALRALRAMISSGAADSHEGSGQGRLF